MIKISSKQTGSAHVIIIVILVIALLGTLGFIFWQNFINNTQKTQEATSVEKQETAVSNKTEESNLKTLPVSELGLTIQYDKTLPDLSYDLEVTDMGTRYANLKSNLLVGDRCVEDKGHVAQIIKNPSDVENQTAVVEKIVIGADVYSLALNGVNCASDPELLGRFQNSLKDNFKNARSN